VSIKMPASFIKYLVPYVYFFFVVSAQLSCCLKFSNRVVGMTVKGKLKTPRCSM